MPLFKIADSVQSSLPEQARAFDFLQGAWTIHHRRLRSRLVGDTEWLEFETPFVLEQILGGLGNIDQCQSLPPSPFYEGVSFRLFDLEAGQWKIYWVDTSTGQLCPPVSGTFDGNHATFFGTDQHQGTPVHVRFKWDKSNPDEPTWQQAFSVDEGATWETNWHMNFRRAPL